MRTLAAVLLLACASPVRAASARDRAREALKAGDTSAAVVRYGALAASSPDGALTAEYAYALAAAGLHDLALTALDRALLLDSTQPDILFFASKVFASLGMEDAAAELMRPAPEWLGEAPVPPAPPRRERPLGTLDEELFACEDLLGQRRVPSAADRFARLTKQHPKEPLVWSGYAIALEQLGAYRAAARAVGRELELSPAAPAEDRELLAGQKAALEARPPLEPVPAPRKANEVLAGKYLAYLGGSYTHTEFDSVFNLNGRVGKFLTDRLNVAMDAGLTAGYDDGDYNGLSLGVSTRYYMPLAAGVPLSATAGARLQYAPGPSDNLSFIVSPGLSYFVTGGSVDLHLDVAVSGPLKDTKTLSVGYTAYFGGPQ